jgi:hypothetical protein
MSGNDTRHRYDEAYRITTTILYNDQYQHCITTIVHKNGMRTWLQCAEQKETKDAQSEQQQHSAQQRTTTIPSVSQHNQRSVLQRCKAWFSAIVRRMQ